jgi:hypothetical protein
VIPASSAELLAAIEGEEAALYAYGVAGPWLDPPDRDLALGGLAAHRARVLALRTAAPDGDERGAPGGFVTGPVDSPDAARALLAGVEARLAATYADLAAAVTGGDRRNAVLSACECSARSIAWGGSTSAFPGR